MDEKDQKILEILREHSDYSTRQIAKKVALPITTIHNRIRKLKQEGIIKKFSIVINHKKTEESFVAYVLISANLQVLKQKQKSQYDIAKELKRIHCIERVDIVSGGTDLIAIVRVKDVEEFDKILLERIQHIEGIEKTQSLIVIHEG